MTAILRKRSGSSEQSAAIEGEGDENLFWQRVSGESGTRFPPRGRDGSPRRAGRASAKRPLGDGEHPPRRQRAGEGRAWRRTCSGLTARTTGEPGTNPTGAGMASSGAGAQPQPVPAVDGIRLDVASSSEAWPTKPLTKRLAGRSYSSAGGPTARRGRGSSRSAGRRPTAPRPDRG